MGITDFCYRVTMSGSDPVLHDPVFEPDHATRSPGSIHLYWPIRSESPFTTRADVSVFVDQVAGAC